MHVGVEAPFLIAPKQPHAPQAEALTDRWPHREFTPENTAIDFLRQTIRSRPGEITLLTIGPLTNIALLFALDPEIPALLKGLMMMGGWYLRAPAGMEHPLRPPCGGQSLRRARSQLTAVGIDVTGRCQLPADECRRRFAQAGGALELVAAMAEVWFRHAPHITFHDPLAAALIFDERCAGRKRRRWKWNWSAPECWARRFLTARPPKSRTRSRRT